MGLSDLRAAALERCGNCCEWPGCTPPWGELEMAHLEHRGMGGHDSANTLGNVVMLCRFHHEVLDGKAAQAGRRREVVGLLRAYLIMRRWGVR